MPPDFSDWLQGDGLLSIGEKVTVIEIAVDAGIRRLRLTGGNRNRARTSLSWWNAWLHFRIPHTSP